MKRARHPKAVEGRSCGTCTACCTVLGVAEISKAVGEPCPMLRGEGEGHGCQSYENRPPSCQDWSCLWLRGVLNGADRPDRVGVVLDMTTDGTKLVARESFPGGLEKAESMLAGLTQRAVVFIIRCDGKREVRGPLHMQSEVAGLIARHSLKVIS